MNRRGFISGLLQLATGAAAASSLPTSKAAPLLPANRIRLRQVIVDERGLADWLRSSEGEKLFTSYLKQNRSFKPHAEQ